MDTSTLILEELRALRLEFTAHSLDASQRLTALETSLKTVVGNGKKGRLDNLEDDMDKLKSFRWKVVGAGAVVSTGLTFLIEFLKN